MSAIKEHHHDQIEAGQRGNEKPILFSTPMVQAILDGRKGMTRRMTGLEKVNEDPDAIEFLRFQEYKDGSSRAIFQHKLADEPGSVKCPYGKAGDLLWVRESFSICGFENTEIHFYYTADDASMWVEMGAKFPEAIRFKKVKPSIHMPKAAARIWLQVEEIRVERLHNITEKAAIAEGIKTQPNPEKPTETQFFHYLKDKWGPSPIHSFQTLWQKINGTESWDSNPWVWVVKFKILLTTGKPEFPISNVQ